MLIYLFETKVRSIIQQSESFAIMNMEFVAILAQNVVCSSEKSLDPMSDLISKIIGDHLHDGLSSILNKL